MNIFVGNYLNRFQKYKTLVKELNLPAYSFRIKHDDDENMLIFDEFRRKYFVLTPEEWVRQHFAHYLVDHKGYPKALIGIEVLFKMNNLTRRADIIVHNKHGHPLMIVECKAPGVKINDDVFSQVVSYNLKFKLKYLIVTNGISHYAFICDLEKNTWSFLKTIPAYNEIKNDGNSN